MQCTAANDRRLRCESVINLQDADEQSWRKTSLDLATARTSDNALHTRLGCVATSASSPDVSAKQPINQLLFSTGKNLQRI